MVQDVFTLDTILTFPQSNLHRDKINITCFEDEIWVYFPGKREDTLDFVVINIETKEQKIIWCSFPSMYFKVANPKSTDIAVSENFITLFFSHGNNLLIFDRKKNRVTFESFIPTRGNLDFLSLKGNELYFGKHYNSHPLSDENKTLLGKYNLITNKLDKHITPAFKNIEFSHFNPKKWVGFGNEFNYFSQTTEYKINIYNNDLECIDSIVHFKDDWFTVPQDTLDKVYGQKSSAKSLINLLESYEDEITRIERIYPLNDEVLFVVWIPPFHKKNNYYRKLDIWKKNEEGKFKIVKENILDARFNLTDTITKNHFSIRMNFNTNYFHRNKLIQWEFGNDINPLNKTIKEIYSLSEEYSMENEDVYVIKIFTINEI